MPSIESLVKQAYDIKQQQEKLNSDLNILNGKIQKYFDSFKIRNLKVNNIVASKRERLNVVYYPEKLREKLDKKTFRVATKRKYYIKDLDKLIGLLKNAGVKPKQFKRLIDVEIEVDKEAIKQLYETGKIDMDDLKGCYDANLTKYIRLEKVED